MFSCVADCLDRPALQSIVELRAPQDAEDRVEWLAERANEGLLTVEERAEYEGCIQFTTFMGILQSKARKKLQNI